MVRRQREPKLRGDAAQRRAQSSICDLGCCQPWLFTLAASQPLPTALKGSAEPSPAAFREGSFPENAVER